VTTCADLAQAEAVTTYPPGELQGEAFRLMETYHFVSTAAPLPDHTGVHVGINATKADIEDVEIESDYPLTLYPTGSKIPVPPGWPLYGPNAPA